MGRKKAPATGGKPVGRNSVSGAELVRFVERVERIREQKKALGDDERQVFAEMQARGFTPKRVREVLKIRVMKPHDRLEAEQELDMYLHAMGMAVEAPLFRAVGRMGVDLAVREQVIDAFKQLVPPNGEIIVKVGGEPVRLWRENEGEVKQYNATATRGSNPDGGYLVTNEMEKEVDRVLGTISAVRGIARVISIGAGGCGSTATPSTIHSRRIPFQTAPTEGAAGAGAETW